MSDGTAVRPSPARLVDRDTTLWVCIRKVWIQVAFVVRRIQVSRMHEVTGVPEPPAHLCLLGLVHEKARPRPRPHADRHRQRLGVVDLLRRTHQTRPHAGVTVGVQQLRDLLAVGHVREVQRHVQRDLAVVGDAVLVDDPQVVGVVPAALVGVVQHAQHVLLVRTEPAAPLVPHRRKGFDVLLDARPHVEHVVGGELRGHRPTRVVHLPQRGRERLGPLERVVARRERVVVASFGVGAHMGALHGSVRGP